ncbi:DUF6440 family protein [Oscillospiraceae bacterium 21-37]
MFGKQSRFSEIHKEGYAGGELRILVDTATGVHYLMRGGHGACEHYPAAG